MEVIKIVLLCILSAVLYGIVHDQFTVRICLEYFTIGHPPIIVTESPTLLALGWGVIATWWVGLLLGIAVAVTSRAGRLSKISAEQLVRPIAGLLATMAATSVLAGIAGYVTAEAGGVWLLEPLRSLVPASKHSAFLADMWAHGAAYATGFLGGIVICRNIYVKRKKAVANGPPQMT